MTDMPDSAFSLAALTNNSALIDQTLTRVFTALSRTAQGATAFRIGDIGQTLVRNLLPLSGMAGETRPEVFPTATGRTTGNFNVTAQDRGTFLRSQDQIAAQILKALMRGKRNM